MDWNQRNILPKRPTPPTHRLVMFSPALGRFCGAIGMIVFGIGTIMLGSRWLHIPPDFWSAGNLTGKAVALVAASFLLALLGMVTGWGIAAGIPVRNDTTNHAISVLWHYMATGSIIWFFLITLALTRVIGRENAAHFLEQFGEWRFASWLIGISMAGSCLIAILLMLTKQIRQGERTNMFWCWLLATPISMAMARLQFGALGVETNLWLLISVLFPLPLIPTSAWLIERDRLERQRFRQRETD